MQSVLMPICGVFWQCKVSQCPYIGGFSGILAQHTRDILPVFTGWYFYYFRPLWPFLESGVFIIFGHFGPFRRAQRVVFLFWCVCFFFRHCGGQYFNYFLSFWPCSEGGIVIMFRHLGRFQRAVLLLISPILAVFGMWY